MEKKITKIGNSYGVTFPKKDLKKFDWNEGDTVSVKIEEDKIVLKKVSKINIPLGIDKKVLEDFIKKYKVEGNDSKND